jgi:hypothetical protein
MAVKRFFLGEDGFVGDGTEDIGGLPITILADGVLGTYVKNMVLPEHFSSISALYLRFRRTSSNLLYMKFKASWTAQASGSLPVEDESAYTTYAGGGTDGAVSNILIPSSAYNALTSMAAGDLFGLTAFLDAAHASNTYDSGFQIVGFILDLNLDEEETSLDDIPGRMILLSEVKAMLLLTDTTKDTLINRVIPLVQEKIMNHCKNHFLDNNIYIQGLTLSFTAKAGATKAYVSDSGSGFVTAGFKEHGSIYVRGSLYNDGVYTVDTVEAGKMTIVEDFETETGGATYPVITKVKFPASIKFDFANLIRSAITNEGKLVKSESLPGGYSVTFKEDDELLKPFNKFRRPYW